MPLGDSITHGYGHDQANVPGHYNYRPWLWKLVVEHQLGAQVDFAGSKNTYADNQNPPFVVADWDRDHQGRAGATTAIIGSEYTSSPAVPDVVLVHAGTNDLGNPTLNVEYLDVGATDWVTYPTWPPAVESQVAAANTAIVELGALIDVLRAKNPNVTIILAKIMPQRNTSVTFVDTLSSGKQILRCGPCGEYWGFPVTAMYNAMIDDLVLDKQSSDSPITVADMFTGYDAANWYRGPNDGVHPDEAGARFMAKRWYDAFMRAIDEAPVYFDTSFDGDAAADLMFFEPSDLSIHVNLSAADHWGQVGSGLWVAPAQFGGLKDNYLPGDFTGDGLVDIAYLAGNNTFHVAASNAQSFQYAPTFYMPPHPAYDTPVRFHAGDFDGDGIDDLHAFRDFNQRHFVRRSNGAAWYGWLPWTAPGAFGTDVTRFFVGDFNGDGADDLGYRDGANTLRIALSNGFSFVESDALRLTDVSPHNDPRGFLVGDFNGDGADDLAFGHTGAGPEMFVRLANPAGTAPGWQPAQLWGTSGGGEAARYHAGDFNADGLTDFAYMAGIDAVYVFVSTGKRFTYSPSFFIPIGGWGHSRGTYYVGR